jgi:20S proteasome alpha/beta subunit
LLLTGRVFQSTSFQLKYLLVANQFPAVEYAMEAISQAGTVMAVLTKEGVVMVAEKAS